jgi:hypothetical protein
MKTVLITLALFTAATFTLAQSSSEIPIQTVSTDSAVTYRLFSTSNIYIYIYQVGYAKWQNVASAME